MSFQSIRVEGTLFSAELLAKLDGPGAQGLRPPSPRPRSHHGSLGDLSEQWHVFSRRRGNAINVSGILTKLIRPSKKIEELVALHGYSSDWDGGEYDKYFSPH
ncbi:MAG: hypothetical protein WCQ50_05980 [Spirochaetota bacterium]